MQHIGQLWQSKVEGIIVKPIYILALALSFAIPAFAKHDPSDYTTHFVVTSIVGCVPLNNGCDISIRTADDHYYTLSDPSLVRVPLQPGYHGVGKASSTWGAPWFEIMWTEGGKVHYHKYNVTYHSYGGR
jgi:hypothetical protein